MQALAPQVRSWQDGLFFAFGSWSRGKRSYFAVEPQRVVAPVGRGAKLFPAQLSQTQDELREVIASEAEYREPALGALARGDRGNGVQSVAAWDGAPLRAWLADFLEEDIGKLTPKCAAMHYERLVNTPTRKTGQPPTAATHRFVLSLGQRMFRGAVSKGYVSETALAAIQPVGRPSRGKKQLRFEAPPRFHRPTHG